MLLLSRARSDCEFDGKNDQPLVVNLILKHWKEREVLRYSRHDEDAIEVGYSLI